MSLFFKHSIQKNTFKKSKRTSCLIITNCFNTQNKNTNGLWQSYRLLRHATAGSDGLEGLNLGTGMEKKQHQLLAQSATAYDNCTSQFQGLSPTTQKFGGFSSGTDGNDVPGKGFTTRQSSSRCKACLRKSTLPHKHTRLRFDAFLLCLPPASPNMLHTLLFSHVHVRQAHLQCVGPDTQGNVFYPKHLGWRNVASCEACNYPRWQVAQRTVVAAPWLSLRPGPQRHRPRTVPGSCKLKTLSLSSPYESLFPIYVALYLTCETCDRKFCDLCFCAMQKMCLTTIESSKEV